MPILCQGPIITIDIAEDDVAGSSEEEVLSADSAVAESDGDED